MTETENPEVYRRVGPMVRESVPSAWGCPCRSCGVIPEDSPNAFATGRNPQHASVAFTVGILQLMDDRELEGVVGARAGPRAASRHPDQLGRRHHRRGHHLLARMALLFGGAAATTTTTGAAALSARSS